MSPGLVTEAVIRHSQFAMLATRSLAMATAISMVACASVSELECDLECGEHQSCVLSSEGPACECVAGYEGEPCEWGGGIRDPEFLDPEAWDVENGATISPLTDGLSDAEGTAVIPESALCTGGGVSQVVEMPAYDDAEPFVVQVRFRNFRSTPTVLYNRATRELRASSAYPVWNFNRFCLGEAGYGGPVKFQIAADQPKTPCFGNSSTAEVDSFEIVPARPGECPAPGEVINGDAEDEDDGSGWRFDLFALEGSPPEGEIAPGIGVAESRAVRLRESQGGALRRATARTRLSVPVRNSQTPSPALEFTWRASERWRVRVGIGEYVESGQRSDVPPFDFLVGDGETNVARYCIRPRMFGSVFDIAFELELGPSGTTGELIVDDVRIVLDSDCNSGDGMLDPSFDATATRWPGSLYSNNAPYDPDATVDVRIIDDPERARTPPGALELLHSTNRVILEAYHFVWVPPPQGDAWPRLSFYSSIPSEPGPPVFWTIGEHLTSVNPACFEDAPFDPDLDPIEDCQATPFRDELLPGLGWRQSSDCLPTDWSERWVRLTVGFDDYAPEEPADLYDPPRSVLLDDFEITFDEGCAP